MSSVTPALEVAYEPMALSMQMKRFAASEI